MPLVNTSSPQTGNDCYGYAVNYGILRQKTPLTLQSIFLKGILCIFKKIMGFECESLADNHNGIDSP
jgi:hypothetical protein